MLFFDQHNIIYQLTHDAFGEVADILHRDTFRDAGAASFRLSSFQTCAHTGIHGGLDTHDPQEAVVRFRRRRHA